MENIPATGAYQSENDLRTVRHEDVTMVATAGPLTVGGTIYNPEDHEHQHYVGICTAISRTQLRTKQTGKKYCADFQYLCQKKFFDKAWYEGSSNLSANKVAKNIGFLPVELWTWTTEQDRLLPYAQYIAKLQAIPDAEIERLKTLCVDKIAGYASVNVNDPQAIAKAIIDSPRQAGILCMYGCGNTWWTGIKGNTSWNPADINPLRKPVPYTSGHAIGMTYFDYTKTEMQKLANTWGTEWNDKGNADIDWSNYPPLEAWVDLLEAPIIKYVFNRELHIGMSGADVGQLQSFLKKAGFFTANITSYYGPITKVAVKAFQEKYADFCLVPAGVLNGIGTGNFGPVTRAFLNSSDWSKFYQ